MRSTSALPFDDIRALLRLIPRPENSARKPSGIGELADWVTRWQGKPRATIDRPMLAIFAADHQVARRETAVQGDTRAQMDQIARGNAAISRACASVDLGLRAFDLALDLPIPDIVTGPAMDEAGCAATIAFGMEAVAGGTDLLCLGAIGNGGTMAASALAAALVGGRTAEWIVAPAGDGVFERRTEIVESALDFHAGHLTDPLEILRRLGGRECAALMGAIIAARMEKIPVILDGFVTMASAAVLHALDETALDHCLASRSGSLGPAAALVSHCGLKSLLDLDLPGNDGLGAVLTAGLLKAIIAAQAD